MRPEALLVLNVFYGMFALMRRFSAFCYRTVWSAGRRERTSDPAGRQLSPMLTDAEH